MVKILDTDEVTTPSYLIFTGLTVFFSFMIYQFGSSDPTDPSAGSKSTLIWGISYIIMLFIGMFYGNMTMSKQICQTAQVQSALLITVIPWVLVFMVMGLMIMIFPGWLTPFSNTIGYAIAKLQGVDLLIMRILKDNKLKNLTEDLSSESEAVMTTISQIYTNKSLIINQITEDNFMGFWTKMKNAGMFREMGEEENELRDKLFDVIRVKSLTAKTIWALITGIFTVSISKSYISDVKCKYSAEEIEERSKQFDELRDSSKTNQESIDTTLRADE